MEFQERIRLTRTIWGMMIMGTVFGSLFTVAHLGAAVLGLVFILAAAAIVMTGFIWQWGAPFASQSSAGYAESEQAKRDRIEAVLRRLSDTQLYHLRERLASGELTDEDLGAMLEDEGSLKRKR